MIDLSGLVDVTSTASRVTVCAWHELLRDVECYMAWVYLVEAGDIGIVTPYLAQVQLITDGLKAAGIQVVEGHGGGVTESDAGDQADSHKAVNQQAVEVKSVDGFQGRQKQVSNIIGLSAWTTP